MSCSLRLELLTVYLAVLLVSRASNEKPLKMAARRGKTHLVPLHLRQIFPIDRLLLFCDQCPSAGLNRGRRSNIFIERDLVRRPKPQETSHFVVSKSFSTPAA